MKDLFISEELALRVTPALEEVAKAARRVRGVPPALQNLFFEVLQPSDSDLSMKLLGSLLPRDGAPVNP